MNDVVLKKKSMEFEIVWVSHDRTSDDFVQYFQQMPWLAMAADRVAVEGRQLSSLFGVRGIPALVLLDASLPDSQVTVLSTDGVAKVSLDPYAREFPYTPALSVLKALLVPRQLRDYIHRKKENSVATLKSALNNALRKASPTNIVKYLLKLVKNRMFALLALLFPNLVKPNMDHYDDL
jgi:hypothetical protein